MITTRLYKIIAPSLFAAVLLALTACATSGGARSPMDQALYEYAGAVRWNEFEVAWTYVDPEIRKEHPLTDLEIERFKQVQVSEYQVKRTMGQSEETFEQIVEIRIVNKHTQTERVITEHERWKFDPVIKQWWLVSGLPKIVND